MKLAALPDPVFRRSYAGRSFVRSAAMCPVVVCVADPRCRSGRRIETSRCSRAGLPDHPHRRCRDESQREHGPRKTHCHRASGFSIGDVSDPMVSGDGGHPEAPSRSLCRDSPHAQFRVEELSLGPGVRPHSRSVAGRRGWLFLSILRGASPESPRFRDALKAHNVVLLTYRQLIAIQGLQSMRRPED